MIIFVEAYGQEQEYTRTLSGTEWLNEVLNCEKSTYELANAEILINYYELERYIAKKLGIPDSVSREDLDEALLNLPEQILVSSKVYMVNCKFVINGRFSNFTLYNLWFKNGLYLLKCNVLQGSIVFRNCLINILHIWDAEFEYALRISDSEIYRRFFVFQSEFRNIELANTVLIDSLSNKSKPLMFLDNVVAGGEVRITDCRFVAKSPLQHAVRFRGDYGIIYLGHSNFGVPVDFEDCSINKSLTIGRKCVFSHPLGVERFQFPERNTHLRWKTIGQSKLCLYDNEYKLIYVAANDSQLVDVFNYSELVSSYSNFYSMYKTRGDRESANACYVQMKDIETRMLKYLYDQTPTIKNYFNWRLNQFLKYFCEYGTSPVQSLIISMYVIIAFAFFYFFFYSDWDRINRSFLIAKSKKLLTYFQSEQKMEDFYTDEHKDELESYQSFKSQISESAGTIPFYMRYLMKPLYRLSLLRYKVISWLYRRTEILSGKWEDLTANRKLVVGSAVGVSLAVYLVYLVLVRSLNSLFLSINTFSTLGFGDIPVKGISRYMAILEGFLGWFLLSIFSVSLISQILQN